MKIGFLYFFLLASSRQAQTTCYVDAQCCPRDPFDRPGFHSGLSNAPRLGIVP